jgi:AraC-like DNA-binding protein
LEDATEWRKTISYTDLSPSRLGRVTLISTIKDGSGVFPRKPLRVYPSYALVLITKGTGIYQDENGLETVVKAGDAILVFPGLAHTYRPDPGTHWDETYVIFDGPAFDAWRTMGVLNTSQPVLKGPFNADVAQRLFEISGEGQLAISANTNQPDGDHSLSRSLQVCSLLRLLCEINRPDFALTPRSNTAWATRACSLLGRTGPDEPTLEQVARIMGVSAVTFRRRFAAEVGTSPALWRGRRRMEAACHLIQFSDLNFAQMAAQLGYADEYHFSKRFKQLVGVSPSQFRNQVRNSA